LPIQSSEFSSALNPQYVLLRLALISTLIEPKTKHEQRYIKNEKEKESKHENKKY